MMKASKKSTLSANKKGTSLRVKALHLAVASCFVASPVHAKTLAEYVYEIQRGTAITSVSGSTVTVKNSPGAILNWVNGLNIQSGERLHFDQLSATSAVLNRVGGGSLTKILGTLSSNGKVFLVNPAGIVVGSGARIDTAGFVASTLNISDNDFVNGKMRFNADIANPGNVTVEAHAEIVTPNGGFVYLLAPNVTNSGLISTPSGEAILAAGHSIEVVDSTDPALRVVVSAQSKDLNLSQAMREGGGNIFSVVNNGTVSANTAVVGQNGKIQFRSAGKVETTANSVVEAKGDANADGGLIRGFADGQGTYAGSFDASGKNGGLVETSAAYLDVSGISHVSARALGANGKAGTWLLDPYDFVIGSTEASLISGALNFGSDVTVDTSSSTFVGYPTDGNSTGAGVGNITVNSAINATAGGGQTLSLVADGAITLNADITGTGFGLTMVADANNGATGPMSAANMIDSIMGPGVFAARGGGVGTFNDGGIVVNSTVDVDETVYIFNFDSSHKVLLDANAAGHAVGITSAADVRILTEGGLRLQGGNGTASGSSAKIESGDVMRIGSGGDIELLAGNGTGGSNYVSLVSYGVDQRIGFHTANKNFTLTGGSAGFNNHAVLLNNNVVEVLQTVGGYSGLDGSGDPIVDANSAQYNPIVTITGGAGSFNSAGMYAISDGDADQYVYAKSITMQAGSGASAKAYVATNAFTSYQELKAFDGTNYGDISLTGGSGANSFTNVNEAGIGNTAGSAEIFIEGANITFNAGSQSGTTGVGNTGSADISLYAHDGDISLTNAKVGASEGSLGEVFMEANNGNVNITNSAIGYSSFDSTTVHIDAWSSGSQGGVITLNNTSEGSGLAADDVYLHASKNIAVTGGIYATDTIHIGADYYDSTGLGGVSLTNGILTAGTIDIWTNSGNITQSGANSLLSASTVNLAAYGGDIGSNSSLIKVAADTVYSIGNNVYVEDTATVGYAQITAYESALLRLDDGIYGDSGGVDIYAPAAVVYSPNDLYLEYTGIDFQNNAMYGGGDYAVIADNLYMYNGHINGSGEGDKLGVFVNNLEMTYNSNISSFFVGINYDPDTLAAIDALGSFAGVKNNVGQTGSVTVAGGSHINGYGVGINTGELNIDGYGGYYYSSGISGGFVNAITTGDLNITGGDNVYYSSYGGAYLSASYEALLTVGGNINITTGAHDPGYYGGSASINVADYRTLYLAFPNAQSGGWSVDGVAGAFTSELNPYSGIFVYNQELDNNEAVLGYNVIVSYGNIAKEIEKATDDVSQRSSRDLTNYSDTTKTTEDSGNDSNPFANNEQDNNDNTTDNNDEENNDENKNNKEDPKSC